jgi:hypothetical protein
MARSDRVQPSLIGSGLETAMTSFLSTSMNRRTALKVGAGFGIAGGAGLLGYEVVPPSPSPTLEPVDSLARQLYETLDAEQRADTCVAYDHPLRQYHNRGVWGGGREVVFGFTRQQRRLLTDLMYAGLSTEGRSRVPEEYFAQWSGVQTMRVLICGNPATPPYQIILTGAHVNLRLGGRSREGAAFGGPQVYGDQRGNEHPGLPGNVYRDQFLVAQRLLRRLDSARQKRAILDEAPVQTGVELQGRRGTFPGLGVSELDADDQKVARALVARMLATYPAPDVAFAQACLQANGGVEGLFFSAYQHGEDGDIPEGQVFRLEGPGAVLYFRGYPHVHAFINIAMDGDAPLSAGELLGDNPAWLDHSGVKTLFETAMRTQTRADAAYYPKESVAGRLRSGPIRSGDIYTLESWEEDVEVGEIHGSVLADSTIAARISVASPIDRTTFYRVATTGWGANLLKEDGGRIESSRPAGPLRDLTVTYLKNHGFGRVSGSA